MSSLSDLALAAQGLAATLSASAISAGDAMRLLGVLAAPSAEIVPIGTSVGASMAAMQNAMNDLFRRAAVVEIAIASSTYQPYSSNDAATVRAMVCGFLDNEILVAGNQGEDGVFNSLRTLRSAVVADLTARGAGLASIQNFQFNASLPACVIAQRLYSDPSREAELVTQANPPHPAFMPATFTALSS